ncbi:MAG: hypothetical protein IPM68_11600 [Flavobacteriales bacterium]|nr:hypothetical protein [Flavobacteriales bacterium]
MNNIISPTAHIGKNLQIGHFCVIEDNVVFGDDVAIESPHHPERRRIGSGCFMGTHSKVGSGAWLGAGVRMTA